jgi:membrane protease YdiL (CAAX protease family)
MTQLPPPTAGPAGWYPDPHGGPTARYFDGRRWAPVEAPAFAPARPPHPTLPARAAVGALVILVASLVAGRLLIDALADAGWPIIVYVAILTLVGYGPSVWWCHHVSTRWGSGRLADDVGLRFRWVDLAWGLLIWVAAVACEIVVAAAVLATGIPTSSNTEGVSELQADRSYVVALLVTAVIAAPLVEEMVFRGVVLRGLLGRTGPALAIVAQALLFGLAHVDPVRGAGNVGLAVILSGVGLALGGGAYLLRRIGPTIVAHAIFNAVVLTIVLTGVADRLQDELDDATVAPVPAAVIDTVAPVGAVSRPAPTAPAAAAPGR